MKFYIEAYDTDGLQILGNCDGQGVLHARTGYSYRRCHAYKAAVQRAKNIDNNVRKARGLRPLSRYDIVDEKGNLYETIRFASKLNES